MSRNKVFWTAQARRDVNLDLQTEINLMRV